MGDVTDAELASGFVDNVLVVGKHFDHEATAQRLLAYLEVFRSRPLPRIGQLTPANAIGQLAQYLLAGMEGNDAAQRRSTAFHIRFTLEIAAGERPIVFLSPAQQFALTHTDVDGDIPALSELSPLVCLAEPIPVFADQPEMPTMLTWGVYLEDDDRPVLLMQHSDGNRPYWLGPFDATDGDWTVGSAEVVGTIRSACAAVGMFGLSNEPSVPVSRIVRRQHERSAHKLRSDQLPPVAIRYLNDGGKVHAASKTTSDATVEPHIRRGHIRHVWTGPLNGDRKREPRLIAPVIVNGHLGRPTRPVAYKQHDPTTALPGPGR